MSVYVKSNTYLYSVVLLFLVPLPWLLSWIVAVVFHELCHYIAVIICGGRVEHLTVSIGGLTMQCTPMTDVKRVIAILFGPLGGLALLVFYRWLPQLAICAWILSAYNLLPIVPLDGGRILQTLMGNGLWFHRVQWILQAGMFLFGIYACLRWRIGLMPLIIALILFCKYRKTPCKTAGCRVQ